MPSLDRFAQVWVPTAPSREPNIARATTRLSRPTMAPALRDMQVQSNQAAYGMAALFSSPEILRVHERSLATWIVAVLKALKDAVAL